MFKHLFIAFAISTLSLYANEIENKDTNLTTIEQFEKCDKIYENCSILCENSNDPEDMKCYANCEAKYDICLQDELVEIKEPSVN